MLRIIKLNAKPIIKRIAQITNVLAIIVGGLQATGVLAMLTPVLNLQITLAILALNYLAHTLKPYVEDDTGTAVKAVLVAPVAPVVTPTAVV
jgi:hypothetical protein